MDKKKEIKLNNILYLIVFLAVVIMLIGTSCAYYAKKGKKYNNEVRYIDLLLEFDNESQINGKNIKPGWEESLEFSLENFSKDTIGKYKIVLEIITPLSNMVDENFVYSIEGVSDSKDTSNKTINIADTPIPVVTKYLPNGEITPKNKHNYKVTFRLKKEANIKNYNGNLFAVRIRIVNDDD